MIFRLWQKWPGVRSKLVVTGNNQKARVIAGFLI